MSGVVTVPELLDGHTVLDIECLDRIYLNGCVPKLQAGGQVVTFLHDHRGMPVASPAVFEQIGTRFRQAVAPGYGINQASYDLGRLARNGLIARIPHRNLYALTPDGLRFAIFYTKVHDRLLRPLMASGQPQAPPPLRAALRVIDTEVSRRIAAAHLPAAA